MTSAYASPGRSTADGNPGWFGASGKFCASNAKPEDCRSMTLPRPCTAPFSELPEYTWSPGCVVRTASVRPLRGSRTSAAGRNVPGSPSSMKQWS